MEVFFNRKMLTVLLLGFSSGIPLALTSSTLQAWLTTEKVDIKTIGLFSLVAWPYTLKFLWAPLMDRFTVPFLGRRLGWVLVSQILLVVSIAAMAFARPAEGPWVTALLALFVAFFSSSQDIVIDAYRTEVVESDEVGPAASLYVTGYRIAMLVSGAAALVMADHLPWMQVYLVMALCMGVGVLTTLFAPKPRQELAAPRSLRDAVVLPFTEFLKRNGAYEILAFVVLYKLDVVLTTALQTTFVLAMGFSKSDIGYVTKGFGLAATIVGTLFGGAMMVRLGMKRSLWTFGIAQGVSGMSFFLLSLMGHHYPTMVLAIAAENFCSGMGNAAYTGFLMRLCDRRYTATQFALLTSLMAFSRVVLSSPSGYLQQMLGWPTYFVFAMVMMIPGLLLLTRYDHWTRESSR